jgi:non-heme chloroperoxidase
MLKLTDISANKSVITTKDGTRLFYKDWGMGKPVVFIHGWAVSADIWEYQMPNLCDQGLRPVAYDKRGCGHSSQPGSGYNFDTFADDLGALIEQLELQEVTLVAHSMGCGDVARYLSRYGADRIERVVMISTNTPFLLKTADNPEGVEQSVFEEMIAALKSDRPHYLSALAPAFFGVGLPNCAVSPEMMQWAISLALQASPQATIEMIRALSETDFQPDLQAFTMPTLVIHGDQDQSHPIALTGRKTAQAIPGSQFKVYEGAAHGLFITHKEQLNRDLLTFIQRKLHL